MAHCLWKLIDALDICDWPDGQSDHPIGVISINECVAMASSTLISAYRIAGQRHQAVTSELKEFKSRSNRSRELVRIRWRERDEHYRFAESLIPRFKFKKRIEVARAIADEVQAEYGKAYGEEIVDGWLKAMNWKTTI